MSSGTSWSRAAETATGSMPSSARICADAIGCVTYGSPEARTWLACASTARSNARSTMSRSACGWWRWTSARSSARQRGADPSRRPPSPAARAAVLSRAFAACRGRLGRGRERHLRIADDGFSHARSLRPHDQEPITGSGPRRLTVRSPVSWRSPAGVTFAAVRCIGRPELASSSVTTWPADRAVRDPDLQVAGVGHHEAALDRDDELDREAVRRREPHVGGPGAELLLDGVRDQPLDLRRGDRRGRGDRVAAPGHA